MTNKEPVGFYWWSDDGYHIVILDPNRKIKFKRGKRTFSWEHTAPTPEALVEACEYGDGEFGYDIGTPAQVKKLCESSPHRTIKRK